MPADLLYRASLISGTLATMNTGPNGYTLVSGGAVSSAAIDLGAGGALPAGSPREFVTRIAIFKAVETSGGGTLIFTMDHSSDNSNWATLAGSAYGFNDIITLTASNQTAEVFIPFMTRQRYVRLTLTVGTTPVGGTLFADAEFMPSFP